MEQKLANDLLDFIYASPSAFHVVRNIKAALFRKGFKELVPQDKWNIREGEKYFTTKNDSSIIAFVVGARNIENFGFNIIAAHTDSPSLKIKPNAEKLVENNYLTLNTEVYGAPILSTWFDRPLSMAGKVSLRSDNPLEPETRFVNFRRPILTLPNLAIHLNREINQGLAINNQKMLLPVIAMKGAKTETKNYFKQLLATELNVGIHAILDYEINLYDYERGSIIGMNDEFISSPKLDNLSMVHAGIDALINSDYSDTTRVMVCFDNEEVGSQTKQGAGSPWLRGTLERILFSMRKDKESFHRALASSFMISADMAHAVHPSFVEKHDPINHPIINKGPVIKINANQKYTSDATTSAIFEMLCDKAGVPVQRFVNNSNEKGGSTLGNVATSQIDIPMVDVGNPMLAMHSIKEFAGVKDHFYMKKVFEEFFSL